MNHSWRQALLMCVALGCAGCASKSRATAPVSGDALQQSLSNSTVSKAAGGTTRDSSRLPGTDNGLEIRKITVPDQPDRFLPTIAKNMHGSAVDPDTQIRLERNGLRMARIPVENLDQLLADLGGASLDLNEWHGQAVEWRPLQKRPIGPMPRAIAIDGNVFRYLGGRMSITLRAWTMQMEDGPCLHLEMLPRFEADRSGSTHRLIPRNTDESIEVYPSMALDMQLMPGFAYVLFGEQPQARWPDAPRAEESLAQPAPAPAKRSIGPMDVTADEGAPPVTFGEFMLVGDRQPIMRGMVVFIPRIAPVLFAPEQSPRQQSVAPSNVVAKPLSRAASPQVSRKAGP